MNIKNDKLVKSIEKTTSQKFTKLRWKQQENNKNTKTEKWDENTKL